MAKKIPTRWLKLKGDRQKYLARQFAEIGGPTYVAHKLNAIMGTKLRPTDVTNARTRGSVPFNWCQPLTQLVPDFDPFKVRRYYDMELDRAAFQKEGKK